MSFLSSIKYCNQELVLWFFLMDQINRKAPAEPQGVLGCEAIIAQQEPYHLFLQLLFCDEHFPLPSCPACWEEGTVSRGQGCVIPVWMEKFWSFLPLGALVFLNLTVPMKPAANDLQVGECIRAVQWSKKSAECLLVLLLTAAWISSVFLPQYHFFTLFSSVEAMTFLSLSQLCLSGVSQYVTNSKQQSNTIM